MSLHQESHSFPILFKKNSMGGIQQWEIHVDQEIPGPIEAAHLGPYIVTINHGQVGGSIQSTSDRISKGKNIGRSNETTVRDQALAEAKSKYEKQLKAGYVSSIEKAEKGETDEIIKGGILPMLAHVFEDHENKLEYPCAVQPKLDGIRCIAIKRGQDVTLWSRTRKPITSCPHIVKAIQELPIEEMIFDGELYHHDLKDQFEEIVSAVRKVEPSLKSSLIQYHIYDNAQTPMSFLTRYSIIKGALPSADKESPLKIVYTLKVNNYEDLQEAYSIFLDQGYEGAMARNLGPVYENKRSYNLLKMKTFLDKEFDVVGYEEGRGKLAGKLGAFWCSIYPYNPKRVYKFGTNPDEDLFKATMSVPEGEKEHFWTYRDNYLGSSLQVKYQSLTEAGLPRFPIGLRIREIGL